MFRKVTMCICSLAVVLFLVSLALPGISPGGMFHNATPGFICFLLGWFFYPSNLALLSSPAVALSKRLWLRRSIGVFLLLSFVAAAAFGQSVEKVYEGFWLWCSSFAVAGTALMPSAPSQREGAGDQTQITVLA